jgi:phenylacetate-CoA ligase
MPVVRYRTRDLTRLLPGTAYPAFRRMEKVTGRTDDMMIVRGRQRVPEPGRGADPDHRGTDAALPVRAVAARQPRRAHRPGRGVRRGADRDALGRALADRVKHRIGCHDRVEVLAPHALERSLGKAKRISDRRN